MVLSALLTSVPVAWVIRGIVVVTSFSDRDVARWWGDSNPDVGCGDVSTSCAAITGVLMPVLFVARTTVLFLFWRQRRVLRCYAHRARTEPHRLVQTAGSLTDEVVGRDQLCNALVNDVRDRRARPDLPQALADRSVQPAAVHIGPVAGPRAEEGVDAPEYGVVLQPSVAQATDADAVPVPWRPLPIRSPSHTT